MDDPQWRFGHNELESRLNVRGELKRLKRDPIEPLLRALGKEPRELDRDLGLRDDFSRYRKAYRLYYLSVDRFLHEMSLAVRWSKGAYYAWRYGCKYTPGERKIAGRYNQVSRFLELDFLTCLLYARILLDRTVSLARYFLKGDNLPSFTSFADHKKFFERQGAPCGELHEYAVYVRERTKWFDMPLKVVRDKFLVHAGPKHSWVFGFPGRGYELGLGILLPTEPERPLARVKLIHVSIPQLTREMEQFLTWFCGYAVRAIGQPSGRLLGRESATGAGRAGTHGVPEP